jgi:hypothetical protein
MVLHRLTKRPDLPISVNATLAKVGTGQRTKAQHAFSQSNMAPFRAAG